MHMFIVHSLINSIDMFSLVLITIIYENDIKMLISNHFGRQFCKLQFCLHW